MTEGTEVKKSTKTARALPDRQKKIMEPGRLLMLNPDVIILDEPFAGVHPSLMEVIYAYIQRVNDEGKAIIIISHQMDSIFSLSQRPLVPFSYTPLRSHDTGRHL